MDFEEMLGIDQLDLSYEVRVEGFDGENFTYSVYFAEGSPEEKKAEVDNAIQSIIEQYEDDYMGYIDVSVEDGKVSVFHDLGNVEMEDDNLPIQEMLKAFDTVAGVKEVIINEGSGFDF